ncbi:craniofacial development protein 2-like [Sitophilus oryzae]|uniref:Craniofacial development protein 2-like n=1 Tax=Sitophilus oryzae TaxID=7048 RepID=A0A6J2YCT2_SITOR|nr:craniofacial development protein 2-like [Sitophilus oryzae]
MEVNILGVSEVHWPGTGMIKSKGKVFYYSGNGSIDQNHQRGVGILMDENLQKSVKNFIPLSERVILIQLLGRPININIIQVYAPTAEKAEDEIEDFYRQLDQVLRLTKSNEINLVLGDFNAKVGKGRLGSVVGNYGLGERNDRGEKLIQYCEENNLTITNTWYKLPSRRLYTWKSPQDNDYRIIRNQIDYILINNRFKNLITKVTTMSGADIESDHNPLRANILLRNKKKPKPKSLRKNLDPKLLRDMNERYENHINENWKVLSVQMTLRNIGWALSKLSRKPPHG